MKESTKGRCSPGHSGKGPKGWTHSDEKIREEVCEALFRSYDVDASDIEIEVKNGFVHLTGKVANREEKRAAEDCVDNVHGVVDLKNDLKFNPNEPLIKRNISIPEDEHGTRLS